MKSLIELEEAFLVLLPERETLALLIEMIDCQVTPLLLNLIWFPTNQIPFNKLIKAEATTTALRSPIQVTNLPHIFHTIELQHHIQASC
jgi:hypothetical protein